MTHINNLVYYGGVDGVRDGINIMRNLRDVLAGHANTEVDVTMKIDGSPSTICGIDPNDGQFFVAKKGIFNKNPKVYKSHADIDADTSGDLAKKLKVAFTECSKLGITGIVQGDLLFTREDIKTETIEGVKYVTFQANTIVYAAEAGSELGRSILKANIGIVFHTSYSGTSFETLKASYSVDISKFKKVSTVWVRDAELHDLSGTASMTASETAEVTEALSEAGKIFNKISSSTLRQVQDDSELASTLETFDNTFIRKGEDVAPNPAEHAQKLVAWVQARFDKEEAEKKSVKGKEAVQARKAERMKFFSPENMDSLIQMYAMQKALTKAKLLLIKKLNQLGELSTFLKTAQGYEVTSHEGFVAIDRLKGGAYKLVDQLSFSHANFNPAVLKAWNK